MALSFSVLIALFGVFVSQNDADLQLPYDPTIYQNLFKGAPYYSFCDLPWLTFYDQSYFVNFNELAKQFNIRVSDLYQMHSIIESNMPTIPYQNEYNILYTAATEVKKEMDRRGLYYLPTPPACYPFPQYPESPLPPTYQYQQPPVLTKRSPYVVAPEVIPEPKPYDPYNPYNTYSVESDYAYELAYKNLYVMLDQYMPNLPSSTYNNIRNSVAINTPPMYQDEIDDVTNQLTTNIRYLLGMAEKRIPPLY